MALVIAGVNPIIYATAIAGIIIPPYSALQEQKITDCKALKETNMAMAREMENLKYNNNRFRAENDELEVSVQRSVNSMSFFCQYRNMKDDDQ